MNSNNMKEEFYNRLLLQLNKETFPHKYLFKFILKADNKESIKFIQDFFAKRNAKIAINKSKQQKYISINIIEIFGSSFEIIGVYREIAKLKGVIML